MAKDQKETGRSRRRAVGHAARGPKPVDVHVGLKIRNRRKELGLSQGNLGTAVGVSFQQMQKYENGSNRVGASRLAAIARALGVSIGYFFPDDDAELPMTADVAARVADLETRLRVIHKELERLRRLL